MLKYFYSFIFSKKENMTIDTLMYEMLNKKQQRKLHNKYNVIIIIKKGLN